jgi:Uncharacterized conserved protein
MNQKEFIRTFQVLGENSYDFFLGSGASIKAGIPTGGKLIWQFKREIYCSETGISKEDLGDLQSEQVKERLTDYFNKIAGAPIIGSRLEYAYYFEKCYPSSIAREKFIQNLVRDREPSEGHLCLVSLMLKGYVKNVWTTNFDSLVESAINTLSPAQAYKVHSSANQADASMTGDETFLKIYKLHGDYRYDRIKNTTEELQKLEELIFRQFVENTYHKGLIVIGYSGSDKSIMSSLDKIIPDLKYGLLWMVRKGEPINNEVKELMEKACKLNEASSIIEIEGFDNFLYECYKALAYPNEIIEEYVRRLSVEKARMELQENIYRNMKDSKIHQFSFADPNSDFTLKLRSRTELPPRDPNFIGREDIIRGIICKLINKNSVVITEGLQGMGGVGKTSIIVEICNIFKENWDTGTSYPGYLKETMESCSYFQDGILWVTFEKDDTNLFIMDKILRQMGIPKGNKVSLEDNLEICRQLLETKDILVVLDSAEQNEVGFHYFYRNLFQKFSVLVSSRKRFTFIDCSDVPILSVEEAVELFQTYYKREVDGTERVLLYEICRKIGYHPLAIKLLASRAHVALKTLQEVVQEFDAKRLQCLKLYDGMDTIDKDVITCFSISYDSLTETQRRIFTAAGVFNFHFTAIQMKEILETEDTGFDDDIDMLVMLHLFHKIIMKQNANTAVCFQLHPLLREYAYSHLGDYDYSDALWARKQKLIGKLLEKQQITDYELEESISTINWSAINGPMEEYIKLLSLVARHLSKAGMWEKEISLLKSGIEMANNNNFKLYEINMHISILQVAIFQRNLKEIYKQKQIIDDLLKEYPQDDLDKNAIYGYLVEYTQDIASTNIINGIFSILRDAYKNGMDNLNWYYYSISSTYVNIGAFDRYENLMQCYISNIFREGVTLDEICYVILDVINEYVNRENYNRVFHYCEKYKDLIKEQKDSASSMNFLELNIQLAIELKDYEAAAEKIKEMEQLIDTFQIDQISKNINFYTGRISLDRHEEARAIVYFEAIGDDAEKSFWLGVAYCGLHKYELAQKYIQTAYNYYDKVKNPRVICYLYAYLAEIEIMHPQKPNYRKAVKLLLKGIKMKNRLTILNLDKEREVQNLLLERLGEADYNELRQAYDRVELPLLQEIYLDIPGVFVGPEHKEMILIPEGPAYIGEGLIENRSIEDQLEELVRIKYREATDCICRKVYLYSYYIDKYPVTNGEYKSFCEATGYRLPSHLSDAKNLGIILDQEPVINITLEDAKAYAKWCGKRLPVEAEWEKACRGSNGYLFPWGDMWDEKKLITGSDFKAKQKILEEAWSITIIPYENPQSYRKAIITKPKEVIHANRPHNKLAKILPANKKFKYEGFLLDHPNSRFDESYFLFLMANLLFLDYDRKLAYLNTMKSYRTAEMQILFEDIEKWYMDYDETLKNYSDEKLEQLYEKNSKEWRKILAYRYFYDGQITKPVMENPAGISPYGVSDMIGNVMEMTESRMGDATIVKGGPYFGVYPGEVIKASDRYEWNAESAETTSTLVGFRCVKPIFGIEDIPR